MTDREVFAACIQHSLASVGATQKLLSEPAIELLFRASQGLLRIASKILRAALHEAHERDQSFIDEHVMEIALTETLPS